MSSAGVQGDGRRPEGGVPLAGYGAEPHAASLAQGASRCRLHSSPTSTGCTGVARRVRDWRCLVMRSQHQAVLTRLPGNPASEGATWVAHVSQRGCDAHHPSDLEAPEHISLVAL